MILHAALYRLVVLPGIIPVFATCILEQMFYKTADH
jgi:hypothetical protein